LNIQTKKNWSDGQSRKPAAVFWILAAFVVLLFATGGSSRSDEPVSIFVGPASVTVCGLALITIRMHDFASRKWPAGCLAAALVLSLCHVIPLPIESALGSMPGVMDDADRLLVNGGWRPLTLTPYDGWNTFYALLVPLATVLAGIQLSQNDLFRILVVIMILGMLSGIVGLMQVVGGENSPFYLYRITNHGEAVGLFANRNHLATMLALIFPMLAFYAGSSSGQAMLLRKRQISVIIASTTLLPLILVVGSRSGLLLSLLSLGMSVPLYQSMARRNSVRAGNLARFTVPFVILGTVLLLGAITFWYARAEAFDRLFNAATGELQRSEFWNIAASQFLQYMPLGSGAGSFATLFQLEEPVRLLKATYLNRAHNDFLETAVTFGLPGLAVLIAFLVWFVSRSLKVWFRMDETRYSVSMARMASVAMVVVLAASITDYPLRTPILMCVFAICALCLTPTAGKSPRTESKTIPQQDNQQLVQ
jgi:O-antigen ligase